MAIRSKRTRYLYQGKRVRFSELSEETKHEWRSKWSSKAAQTRSKARRLLERERARVERERARIERQRLREERAKSRAIAIEAKRLRAIERARLKVIRDKERAIKRAAIDARKVERARLKVIRDKERAIKRAAIDARKVEREKIRAEKAAAKAKRRRSLAAKKGWKERKRKAKERSIIEQPIEPSIANAKNQSELMRKSFMRAKERVNTHFPGLQAHFLIKELASGAVWGRLAIINFPFGFDQYTFLIDLENWVFVPSTQWLWITLQGHFYVKEKEPGEEMGNPYRQIRGMDNLPIYPQKPGIGEAYMWTTARDILNRLIARDQEAPEVINVNLYWDSLGEQPSMHTPLLKSSYGRTNKRRKKKG